MFFGFRTISTYALSGVPRYMGDLIEVELAEWPVGWAMGFSP